MLLTASLKAQTSVRVVPDSMTCLSPVEMNYFIDQVYIVKEQGTSLVLKSKEISSQRSENEFLRNSLAEKNTVIDLHVKKEAFCQSDKKFLEGELHKANRGKRLFKTGFIITGALAVTELGYIGVMRIFR